MKRLRFGLLLAILISSASTAFAANDTIYFGGVHGAGAFGYFPHFPTVNLGDTVVWVGPFSAPHTLQSEVIPAGASTFSKLDETGGSFSYPVTVAGVYHFECTLHASFGMVDSFTTATAGVNSAPPIHMLFEPIYPNPAKGEAMVDFFLDNNEHVTMRIFNSLGNLVETVADKNMDAGPHMIMFDTKQLAAGTYLYALQAGDAVLERNLIVVK